MRLIRFGEPGAERPGLLTDEGERLDCSGYAVDWDADFLRGGGLAALPPADPGELPAVPADARWAAPIARPGKILAIGLNYSDHAAESGAEVPPEPKLFTKAANAICGPGDPIIIPGGSERCDWEVELAVVIGRDCRYLASDAAALDCVAGYCTANDVSEREFQQDRCGQWVKGKSSDNFFPLGPALVTADEVIDPQALDLYCEVNGERRQDGNTGTMLFPVAHLVRYLSRFMTLEAGDVISTGTPPGVGMAMDPPTYLRPGDEVVCEVVGLGRQRHRCEVDGRWPGG